MIPLHSAWWLADHHWFAGATFDTEPPAIVEVCGADCDQTGLATLVLVVAGSLVLLMILVIDVLIPLHRDKPLAPWLKATALIPVPYILLQAARAVLT
ncbi:hypothetical protein OG453_34410 [Streptomyces sp. NBC_01381]|uniref:hypothetical protein n=1 Tax=Streptomyces sp. NBC_01381 TaxID=2903845 RepID=UPI00224EFEFE|nr:hypothetical protein [Streptomyces sp. NBC_01381]MCX4671724.1 hypothetical protein [Streptomyces sp. NBC_01381]